MEIYNSLSRKKEKLELANREIRLFVCGPTVYDYIHIGNARTFVFFDVVAKYFRHKNYQVHYIQNITDVEDKIINRAQEEQMDPFLLAKEYAEIFREDMQAIGVTAVDRYAAASDHIKEVAAQTRRLIDKGRAYLIENDGWYFDLSTFPDYGKLSGRTVEMAEDAVSRIDENPSKRNRGDFCLWKFSKPGEPSWETELGAGRPGWHIEDTAITEKYFGPQYDIHGGGQDLIFPHHEAEIAQQESASGLKPFVRYWLHVAFVVKNKAKMSKSSGNFATLHDLLQKYSPTVLRFYLLSAHYRSPLDWSDQNLLQAEAATVRLGELIQKMRRAGYAFKDYGQPNEILENFEKEMNDDFNLPQALAAVFDAVKKLNMSLASGDLSKKETEASLTSLAKINQILGVIPETTIEIPAEILGLVEERENFRTSGNFSKADEIREKVNKLGYQIDDTQYGPLIKKI